MKRILYIEDSVTSQLILRRIISDAHEMVITPTPQAARLLLDRQSFDLVITDFLFPQGDALDVIVPLRQAKSVLELPIIAVSGSMDMSLMSRLAKVGVNACLPKPLKAVEFRALVDRMLETPFVEELQSSASTVACFQWFAQGSYHEYCPEINVHLTGMDRPELTQRMQSLLHERAAEGRPLGFTTQEKVSSYQIQHPVEAEARRRS